MYPTTLKSQVELSAAYAVTNIRIWGIEDGEDIFYVTSYQLHYSNDGTNWEVAENTDGSQNLVGNTESNYGPAFTQGAEETLTGFTATYLKILPRACNEKCVIIWELFGCRSTDGMLLFPCTVL